MEHPRELIDRHRRRCLKEPLLDVMLSRKSGSPQLTWSGWLQSAPDTGRFSIVLEAKETRFDVMLSGEPDFGLQSQAGEIVSEEELFSLCCRTSGGLRVKADGIHPSQAPDLLGPQRLGFEPDTLAFESESAGDMQGNSVVGVINAFRDDGACRFSSPLDSSSPAGEAGTKRNWYSLNHAGCTFALGREFNEHRELVAWQSGDVPADIDAEVRGFLHALSFYTGERVEWLGFVHTCGGTDRVVLKQPCRKTAERLPNPLPQIVEGSAERDLITKASDYFVRPESRPILQWLAMLWDSADCFHPVQCLVAGTVLEGIARRTAAGKLDEDTNGKVKRLKRNARRLVERNWRKMANDIDLSIGDQFQKGILGGISNANRYSAREILRLAAKRVDVGISKEEVEAWTKLRNPLAHGDYGSGWRGFTEVQSTVDQHNCTLNLIYKLVFGLIGYRGPYVDFSARGFPTRTETPGG